ncbi:MAG: flavin reductase family protein [Flavobacteriaceae bacterium]|jgi:flavin reductase (DIM6/NTAB) family NADH-FMN oxidoreductase RutF|nr:flavin reductase family protein [Flavobacteriaceae bacterium]MBT3919868.1 flavin reductase family protein [Flavobacteriaceae bacterium]MBT6704944.1 flavin reductase family protein [Flavobacteriaceae bacterium]MBT7242238.1 flavin reductase family protein [Flavobacteriaceae bacterium]
MISITPQEVSTAKLHGYLLSAVSPRPIAFASTMDEDGNVNLSPFSFFNVFSANPPILIFSPARRVRDNTTKHTLENVLKTKEVVINIVNFEMVQQMSLSSTEYPNGVNEFVKAGFTQVASDMVKPPRVGESPVQFECKVNDVIALGAKGGAGNLIIAEVVKLHIKESILDAEGKIDAVKIDTVARMGANWYNRSKEGMFEVLKPIRTMGIGVDALPISIRNSTVLTGNDLGILGNSEKIPTEEEVREFIKLGIDKCPHIDVANKENTQKQAQDMLQKGIVFDAFRLLLAIDLINI